MSKLKIRLIAVTAAFGLALTIAVLCGVFWLNTSITVDHSKVDPAVDYLNSSDSTGPQYADAYYEHKGKNLHYVEAGSGELVVFLHGFPSYWLSMVRQTEFFKSDYHVLAVDGMGVGRSDVPTELGDYSLEAMAEHLIALIDSKGAERFHLVGHDWGAVFAFSLAQRFPERAISVTGISGPPQNAHAWGQVFPFASRSERPAAQ